MKRIAVVYKQKCYMPMKASRVAKFLKTGKGQIRYDRKLKLHYLQLFTAPSGSNKQQIRLGIDPGSCFDGFSVVSKTTHHENYELMQRPKKGNNAIKTFKARQAMNRRVRRSRLWHRKIRFECRTASKLTPTIRANNDFRQWLIKKICYYYPITEVELEDVRFDHYENNTGKSFSHVELGKNSMMNFIRQVMKIQLTLTAGWETAKYRKQLNDGNDVKVRDKGSKEFNAHCIDSYVLACPKGYPFDESVGDYDFNKKQIKYHPLINYKVVYIKKIVKVRRCLSTIRKRYKDACKYYKQLPGGEKLYYINMSNKAGICRVKQTKENSNHPKQWTYINKGYAMKFKCKKTNYGGTRLNGKTFLRHGEWQNRTIEVVYG